ncbi:MAG TPA: ABC transporter permease [Deltaproteobacteria bacterium]|nr:ABC transporter permease [Deltaproteobacteria bacterium]
MTWRRFAAIARKEFIHIWRDGRSLGIALFMPIMQMALIGYGASLDVKHVPVCTSDREGSQRSQDLLKRFQASEYFDLVECVPDDRALIAAIDAGRCRLGLVIPTDFSERLRDTASSTVQAIVDGTDDNTANVAIAYAQAVVSGYSAEVRLDFLSRRGLASQAVPPLSVESRVWFNEDLESRAFIIPGVVALVMALIGALLSSLTIAREWERGTMEQLISTPVRPLEIMLGKLLPYFLIGLLDALLCVSIAVGWFGVPFRGTYAMLLATTALFLVVVLGVGYIISVWSPNQLGASQIALLVTLLPTTLLSGFAFPIDQMPAPIRLLTYAIYPRYYVTILKAIFLKGAGPWSLAMPIFALAAYAFVIGVLATRTFRKKLG